MLESASGGGVSAPGVSAPRGCLLGGGSLLQGVSALGVSAPGGLLLGGCAPGGCLLWGGVLPGECAPTGGGVCSGGEGIPACPEADPPREQNDRQV